MRSAIPGLAITLVMVATAQAQTPLPIGAEFQVNTYTTDYQGFARVGGNANGEFVVVWESYGSYGSDNYLSVQGQRFMVALFADGFESGDISAWSSAVP